MKKNNASGEKSQIKKVISGLVLTIWCCALMVGIFYAGTSFSKYYNNNKFETIKKNGIVTDCEVVKTGNMKGDYVVAKYYYNEKKYEIREGCPAFIEIGEKYKIMVDTTDPNESVILFESPFFYNTDITDVSIGEVTKVLEKRVTYEYSVGGIRFKKIQGIINKKLKVGDTYEVQYLVSNPAIAIIKLPQERSIIL